MPSDFGEDAITASKDLTRELEMLLQKYSRYFSKQYTREHGIEGEAGEDEIAAIACDTSQEARILADELKRCGIECAVADALGDEERAAFSCGGLRDSEDGRVIVAKAKELGAFMTAQDFKYHKDARKDVATIGNEEKRHVSELAAEKKREQSERAGKEQDRGVDPNSR